MIGRLLAWLRPPVVPAAPPSTGAVSPRDVGLYDAMLDGWFLNDSGELLKGFAITAQDTLLDVGCGEGVATLFAVRQGASVIFTDSEHDKVRSLARQVEAQTRAPFLGLAPARRVEKDAVLPDLAVGLKSEDGFGATHS